MKLGEMKRARGERGKRHIKKPLNGEFSKGKGRGGVERQRSMVRQ